MSDDRRYEPIGYQGPDKEYRSGMISNVNNIPGVSSSEQKESIEVGIGYSDPELVDAQLKALTSDVQKFISDLETELLNYSLVIKPDDADLQAAYDMVYLQSATPNSALTGYVHFFMYKSLMRTKSNAAQYLRTKYEDYMSDVSGSNHLDILRLLLYTNNEALRIREFIDGFIGDLDDTSEYRVVEAFQTWIENANYVISELRKTFKGQGAGTLPSSDLDLLDKTQASRLQALFKVKLNAINGQVRGLMAQLDREFSSTADAFYKNFLGPALKFRLSITRDLGTGLKSAILANEVQQTVSSLDSNFSVNLVDLIRRAKSYNDRCLATIVEMNARATYRNYINQLGNHGGTIVNRAFTNARLSQEELKALDTVNLVKDFRDTPSLETNFTKAHSELDGVHLDDAHPQYLLKAGDTITGDIKMAPGATIAGVDIANHRHDGTDGSQKIKGQDIEYSSITGLNVDTTAVSTGVPTGLAVVSQNISVVPPGVSQVSVDISFNVETDGVANYEVEITKVS